MPRTTRKTKRLTATERSGAAIVRISTAMRRDGSGRVPGLFVLYVVQFRYTNGEPQHSTVVKSLVRTRREAFATTRAAMPLDVFDEASRAYVLDAVASCWRRVAALVGC